MAARTSGVQAARQGGRAGAQAPRMGTASRVVGIVAGAVAVALVALYCAGCVFFYQRFWPATVIGDTDVSTMSAAEAKAALEEASKVRTVSVSGQGVSFVLTGENAGLELNVDSAVSAALASKASWQWPLEVMSEHDDSDVLSTSFDSDLLRSTIEAQLAAYNSMASDPVDAFLYFDANTQSYQINPGSLGTKLDADSVMQSVMSALAARLDHAALTSANLVQQGVKSDDARLLAAQQAANAYLACNFSLTVNGAVVATIDPSLVQSWIVIGDDYSVSIDDGQLTAWFETLEGQLDTVNQTRYYTRFDGKEVTVANSGKNTYGWISDGEQLLQMIRDAVYGGAVGSSEVPFKQTAAVFVVNGADWGSTYIDIDLGEQYVRYYVDGTLQWESACMTGLYGVHDTPTGVYYINALMRDQKLVAVDIDPATGKPEYEVPVQYWMPFIGNLYALHDNPYREDSQYAYGGTYYYTEGSHGCVNLPISKAASLWNLLYQNSGVGTPVIVHY